MKEWSVNYINLTAAALKCHKNRPLTKYVKFGTFNASNPLKNHTLNANGKHADVFMLMLPVCDGKGKTVLQVIILVSLCIAEVFCFEHLNGLWVCVCVCVKTSWPTWNQRTFPFIHPAVRIPFDPAWIMFLITTWLCVCAHMCGCCILALDVICMSKRRPRT